MPRNQVYGKRQHVYAKTNIFQSPVKKHAVVDVLEITEELGNLAVKDADTAAGEKNGDLRKVLATRHANEPPVKSIPKSVKNHSKRTESIKIVETHVVEDHTLSPPEQDPIKRNDSFHLQEDLENVPVAVVELIHGDEAKSAPKDTPHEKEEECIQKIPENVVPDSDREPDVFEQHTADILNLSAQGITNFDAWSGQLASHFSISKIAEASFGEVYRLSLLDTRHKLSRTDESVLKIISLKPPPASLKGKKLSKAAKEKHNNMSSPEDVASEVRLLQRMTRIPGFTNFRDVTILKGRPGQGFVDAWRSWNDAQKSKGKDASVFPDPGKKTSYRDDQLWAVIEMQDAGTDLENTAVNDIFTVWDIFWNVVLTLGKGEEGAKFEHRDLHLGNICVSQRNGGHDVTPIANGAARFDANKKLGFTGIETTIIDYTLSRAEMAPQQASTKYALAPNTAVRSPEDASEEEGDIAYLDLEKDEALFSGDSAHEYQYEIYRYMRSAVYLDDPLADIYERWDEADATGRTWRGYHPQTNLVWLHFVLYKLLEQIEWPSDEAEREASEGEAGEAESTRPRSLELETALRKVEALLDPEAMPRSGLRSAADLVALALAERWLDVEDVLGTTSTVPRRKGTGKTRRGGRKGSRKV